MTASESWPADKVERRAITALQPYAANSRTHSEAQIGQIAASIREWGWTAPVLIDEDQQIIAGHARVMAAKVLGLADIPVVIARGWSEAQRRAYVIADNKLTENGGWDADVLRVEFAALDGLGFDLGMLGFSPPELAAIRDARPAGLTDPDEAPEAPAAPTAISGDLWALGRHRVLCGDATNAADVVRALNGVAPNLMATDPPYGVNYDATWRAGRGINKSHLKMGAVPNDDRADWRDAWQLFTGSIAYVWSADLRSRQVCESLESSGFALRAQIIWAKDKFALGRGDYHFQHEPCWYAVRGRGDWHGDRSQSTLWNIPARDDAGHGHSTQKPVECMRRPIENNSSAGQAVYDPFVGSGTTIIAAEMTGRACHAIEISPAYVDVAIMRWQNFTGEAATLDGRTFEQVKAARMPKVA